jgi:hypothetical protein
LRAKEFEGAQHYNPMYILNIKQFTKRELDAYAGNIAFQELIRFCIDIQHRQIVLLHGADDHIAGTKKLLEAEYAETLRQYRRAHLIAEELPPLMCDHIIGGSIYESPDEGLVLLIGGTSSEMMLRAAKLKHTKAAFDRAMALALTAFSSAFSFTNTHVIPH